MTKEDQSTRIKKELTALKAEEVALDNDYRYKYHSGMGTFDILQDIERIRERRVELETALKILEEYK
jgi:hypothetical protein